MVAAMCHKNIIKTHSLVHGLPGSVMLHTDTPLKGTLLECIVFSKSDEAVFALKCGDVEKIVQLNQPMLILLDSKTCKHAAQRTEVEARAAFAREVHKTLK